MIIKKIENDFISAKTKSGIYPFKLDICLYIVDGLLIDAGSGAILKKTRSLIKGNKINSVALTHVHEDHTGAAAWIKESLQVPVYLHRHSIAEASMKSSIPLYRWLVWRNRDAFTADPMPEFIETDKYRFDVINAPGHHQDHVVFHEKSRGWLFSGDLYVSRRQAVAFKDENIGDAIVSIQKILELDFDTIFCGHSGIQKKGKEKLRSKLDYFLTLQEKVRALEKEGLESREIDRRLFPKKNLWTVLSGGEWSSLNMVKTI
ncbi:MBL fold metallo-hydrolase [Desulfoluna sp.]|uniref:MBL fold metallo-hydrolase n=1 Tax=Desulfoluna sp. TaxID=2045199 RepID=UPI00260C8EA3|nr:MBL fold metallo-hydrolase [Desulfoluna sp.]